MLKRIYRWLVGDDLNLLKGEIQTLHDRLGKLTAELQRDQVNCLNMIEFNEAHTRELKLRIQTNKSDIELAAKLQGRLNECLR